MSRIIYDVSVVVSAGDTDVEVRAGVETSEEGARALAQRMAQSHQCPSVVYAETIEGGQIVSRKAIYRHAKP